MIFRIHDEYVQGDGAHVKTHTDIPFFNVVNATFTTKTKDGVSVYKIDLDFGKSTVYLDDVSKTSFEKADFAWFRHCHNIHDITRETVIELTPRKVETGWRR